MASPLLDKDKQSRLKVLIAKGKEQGYLTYSEVNDHIPEGIVDPSQIEDIINTITDMGIRVLETAPDAESIVLSDASVSDDDDETTDEAVAALASIESELGRTTDPVRMYMREMGSVELLTREGEIEIAKRIEEGLKQVLQALATNPKTVLKTIELWDKVQEGEMRMNELIVDFHKSDEELDRLAEEALLRAAKEAELAAAGKQSQKEDITDTGPDAEKVKKVFA
ncbi:MAG: RNA polymerase sigma factor RpoD, partial [Gammaproteobacteria bacterium]|nr:RNA polymerase sigma factor RpoD [Gammaproteobacteria bacterium]